MHKTLKLYLDWVWDQRKVNFEYFQLYFECFCNLKRYFDENLLKLLYLRWNSAISQIHHLMSPQIHLMRFLPIPTPSRIQIRVQRVQYELLSWTHLQHQPWNVFRWAGSRFDRIDLRSKVLNLRWDKHMLFWVKYDVAQQSRSGDSEIQAADVWSSPPAPLCSVGWSFGTFARLQVCAHIHRDLHPAKNIHSSQPWCGQSKLRCYASGCSRTYPWP